MNLLLITKNEKKHYVLIKDFNTFMYNQSKHKNKKHFCMYCLQCFSSERILANHVNNCSTINGKQAINMPRKGEIILRFNNFSFNSCQFLSKSMPISRLSRKRYKVVNKVKRWRRRRDHTPKLIRLMKTVAMDIRSYVATKRNIANQSKHIEVKMPFITSRKGCLNRLNTAKALLRKGSTNHW